MRLIFSVLLILVIFNGCALAQVPQVCFQKDCIAVTVTSTEEEMIKGLSWHKPLKSKDGMLFIFDKEGKYSFWMNDMKFNLDILWLNKTGKVVYIMENLPPCTHDSCPKYSSSDPAQYVLETSSGYVKEHHIKIGDNALLSKDHVR